VDKLSEDEDEIVGDEKEEQLGPESYCIAHYWVWARIHPRLNAKRATLYAHIFLSEKMF
jgi:hypothetical protein